MAGRLQDEGAASEPADSQRKHAEQLLNPNPEDFHLEAEALPQRQLVGAAHRQRRGAPPRLPPCDANRLNMEMQFSQLTPFADRLACSAAPHCLASRTVKQAWTLMHNAAR